MGMNIDTAAITSAYAKLTLLGTNISNQNTVGFKSSSFSDTLGQAVAGNNQSFTQGAIQVDNKPLDVAISGNGFFKLLPADSKTGLPSTSLPAQYTRDGQFSLNSNNYLVNGAGSFLIDAGGKAIQIPPTLPPSASSTGTMQLNLDSGEAVIPAAKTFNPSDSTTFNKSSSTTIFDADGKASTVTVYYVKSAANTWDVYSSNSATPVANPPVALTKDTTLIFNASGALTTPTPLADGSIPLTLAGAAGVSFTVNKPTQSSNYFGNSTTVDGNAKSQYVSCTFGSDGSIRPTYSSNGVNVTPAATTSINLFTFTNNNGLQQSGLNTWVETAISGAAQAGAPTSSGYGSLQAGATESSNVDTTKAMVDLLSAQRAFQAESQVINTQSQILQEVAQLGR